MAHVALLDAILSLGRSGKITPAEEVKLIEATQSKGETMAENNELAKVFEEHNTKTPHSEVKDQCQCKDCKAYRDSK